MEQDVAIARAQALKQQGLPVEISFVLFQYCSGGRWKAVNF